MQRLAIALLLCTGCSTKLPGEVVGTYRVTMKLEENTCGPNAVFLSDGKSYSVQLRADGNQGYWRLADGKPLPGKYTQDKGAFAFTFSSIVATSDPDAGEPVCQLQQNETLSGKIHGLKVDEASEDDDADAGGFRADAGVEDGGVITANPTTLSGTHQLDISPAAGSDCRQAFQPRGPFAMLPCKVVYRLSGQERDDF
jgi:hypothetical protein